jgi:RNA polymerase sigma-70 factor (sigma-E family)
VDERKDLVERLFAERYAETVRLAWGLTGDALRAQELAQEAFVRLYVHRRRLRDPLAAPAYLRRTVVNLAFSESRRNRRDGEVADSYRVGAPTPELGGLADGGADRLDLVAALAGLAPRRRACVVLRYYLDLTEVETAAALGISLGTVKSQTHKALMQLRARLEPAEITLEGEERP